MATREKPFVVLDPVGPQDQRAGRRPAGRRPTLDGATIGLIANGLGESQKLLDAVYAELGKQYELSGSVRVLKRNVSVAPDPEDLMRLKEHATAVVTGFGG